MVKQEKITKIVAILYFILLTWIIVFKMQFSLENLQGIHNINLIPFNQSVIVNGKIDFDEIIDNIIIFIPAGVYIQMLKKDWKLTKKIGILAGISLTFELTQYILSIGATDITDLITNTLGGVLGLGIYEIFHKICKSEEKTERILNGLAVVGTSIVVAFLGLLIWLN